MRVKSVITVATIFTLVALIGVTFAFPPIDDLMVENPFWNGLSDVYILLNPTRIEDLDQLENMARDPSNSTLLILGPSAGFSNIDVYYIRDFLTSGGLLVLADDFGTANELLTGLNSQIRINGTLLQDQLFKDKNALMPEIYNVAHTQNSLVMNYPSILSTVDDVRVLAWSSPFSYTSNTPSLPADSIQSGSFPVVAETSLGDGRLIVVSDSSLFINGMIGRGSNKAFLLDVVDGEVFIDESHSMPSRLSIVKGYIVNVFSFLRLAEIRYGLSLVGVFAIFSVKWIKDEEQNVAEDVDGLLKSHPEYDRDLVERLSEQRRRVHGY